MTIRRFEALKWASSFLKQHHRDENIGEILLCYRLRLTRTQLFADIRQPLEGEDMDWLKEKVCDHALKGVPVQYMIGRAPFYGRTFKVTPDVLIPRPETEELVMRVLEWADRFFPEKSAPAVWDIGTGSGAIAITLALERPDWHVFAVDLSEAALAVAKENARRLGACVQFGHGSLLKPLAGRTADILVSNPPYISKAEMGELEDVVKNYEPHLALFGGDDGLDAYRAIIRDLPGIMKERLLLALEIGAAQGEAVKSLIVSRFPRGIEALSVEKDIAGHDRNVMAVLGKPCP